MEKNMNIDDNQSVDTDEDLVIESAEKLKHLSKYELEEVISRYLESIFYLPIGFLKCNSDLIDVNEIRDGKDSELLIPWKKEATFYKNSNIN